MLTAWLVPLQFAVLFVGYSVSADFGYKLARQTYAERGNFSPRGVVVPAGEKVKLRVRSVDTVMHGFTIPALGVESVEISAGHQVVLEFTPEEAGEYDFHCTT